MAGVRLSNEFDPDDASEIGGAPARPAASMTLIAPDEKVDGGLVYFADVPLVSFGPVERRIRYRPPGSSCRESANHSWRDARWYRIEAKVDRSRHNAEWHFIVAEHPYASGLVTSRSVFKPERSDNVQCRPNPLALEHTFPNDDEMFQWIDERAGTPRDLWESRSRLTAGISHPDGSWFLDKPPRTYSVGALFVLGACEDPGACARSLLASERADRLRDATRKNRLHFWHPNTETATADGELRLFPEVEARTEEILLLSARQALAGPHEQDAAKIAKWIGRPVVDKLDHIYCGHMNNLNRACRPKR